MTPARLAGCVALIVALDVPGAGAAVVSGTVLLRLDGQPVPGVTVRYTALDGSGTWAAVTDSVGQYHLELSGGTAVEDAAPQGAMLQLGLPYPNPFNPTTLLPVQVDEARRLRLTVFGVLGQPVRTLVDAQWAPGRYAVPWDGRDDAGRPVAAGVYLLCLSGRGGVRHGKVTLIDGPSGSAVTVREAAPFPVAMPASPAAASGDGLAYDVQGRRTPCACHPTICRSGR